MSLRTNIVNDLLADLRAMDIEFGYNYDYSSNEINHWRVQVEPDTKQKVISIKDRNISASYDAGYIEKLQIDIEIACKMGSQNYDTLVNIIDDVKKCLFDNESDYQSTYGFAFEFIYAGESFDIVDDGTEEIAEAIIEIEIPYKYENKYKLDN